MKPIIYVVANKALNMSAGKLAAQTGHAVVGSVLQSASDKRLAWLDSPHRWLIVLSANDEAHLHSIGDYLTERHVDFHKVIDEGVNEIPALTATAIGVEILDKDSQEASYLSGLPKYRWDPAAPSWERTEIWNDAVSYMENKPWHKRLWTSLR